MTPPGQQEDGGTLEHPTPAPIPLPALALHHPPGGSGGGVGVAAGCPGAGSIEDDTWEPTVDLSLAPSPMSPILSPGLEAGPQDTAESGVAEVDPLWAPLGTGMYAGVLTLLSAPWAGLVMVGPSASPLPSAAAGTPRWRGGSSRAAPPAEAAPHFPAAHSLAEIREESWGLVAAPSFRFSLSDAEGRAGAALGAGWSSSPSGASIPEAISSTGGRGTAGGLLPLWALEAEAEPALGTEMPPTPLAEADAATINGLEAAGATGTRGCVSWGEVGMEGDDTPEVIWMTVPSAFPPLAGGDPWAEASSLPPAGSTTLTWLSLASGGPTLALLWMVGGRMGISLLLWRAAAPEPELEPAPPALGMPAPVSAPAAASGNEDPSADGEEDIEISVDPCLPLEATAAPVPVWS